MSMDGVDFFLLALIEGFSEFLPVSSTGHMILFDSLVSFGGSGGKETFMVVIQAGAILAVLHLYLKGCLAAARDLLIWVGRGLSSKIGGHAADTAEDSLPLKSFLLKLGLSVLPFGAVGYLFRDQIKALFTPGSVALALIAGGVLMVLDDVIRMRRRRALGESDAATEKGDAWSWTWTDAAVIGVSQCLALWPGFSRSAASILGARWRGYAPEAAAHLSFLVGVPTLLGTAGYEFLSHRDLLAGNEKVWLFPGILLAWFSAWVSVKWFLKIVGRGGMAGFGLYRVLLGVIILWAVAP